MVIYATPPWCDDCDSQHRIFDDTICAGKVYNDWVIENLPFCNHNKRPNSRRPDLK